MPAAKKPQPGGLLTSPARLRKIDLLHDKNIPDLPLPQLVVVGDQGTGKSSLLESLTGIPFPRSQERCTRYATRVTHRRENEPFIKISIIPGPGSSADAEAKLKKFDKSALTTAELHDQLPSILDEVNKLMSIHTPNNPDGTKTFTEDVLKIEKCGPNEDYLTVIDVPGIFRLTTEGRTTKADVAMVPAEGRTTKADVAMVPTEGRTTKADVAKVPTEERTTEADKTMVLNMVQNYIRDDQTIILAVIPCNIDLQTQEILGLAAKYDPTGQRTLGILTKPDLALERSRQNIVCSLVRGEKWPLNLGYHVVRSRGGDDDGGYLGDEERDFMFRDEPWRSLSPDRVGVVSLRQRLQHLLGDLTDRAFPKLRSETRKLLQEADDDLSKLGKSRQTTQEQQQFLVAVASEFQQLVRAALNADYSSRAVFDDDKFRLITNVLNASDKFKTDFVAYAHTYEFIQRDKGVITPPKSDSEDEKMALDQFPDLDAVIVRDLRDDVPAEGIMEWIRNTHRRSRGNELISFHPTLFSTTLREQTSKWMARVEYYVSQIIYMIHEFLLGALEVSCPDKKVREELLSKILDSILDRYKTGMQQSRLLVKVERDGNPYTLNDVFRRKLSALQGARIEGKLNDKVRNIPTPNQDSVYHAIPLKDVQSTFKDKDSGKYIAEEVHDLIKSYYEVARDRFIDNVYLQSVSHSLISGDNSPLAVFSENWVLGLEPDRLAAIAGESFQTREQRSQLTNRIKDLEEAVAILC